MLIASPARVGQGYPKTGPRQRSGPPSDRTEADRIEWIPLADIPGLIDRGAILSGPTLIALLYLLMPRE